MSNHNVSFLHCPMYISDKRWTCDWYTEEELDIITNDESLEPGVCEADKTRVFSDGDTELAPGCEQFGCWCCRDTKTADVL